jgi:hypothetical protein
VASRFRGAERIDDPNYFAALLTLTDVAIGDSLALWFSRLGLGPSPTGLRGLAWDHEYDRVSARVGPSVGVRAGRTQGGNSRPASFLQRVTYRIRSV